VPGRPAGIEGAIHTVQQATKAPPIPPEQPASLEPPGLNRMEGRLTQPPDLPAEPDGTQPTNPSGALLEDAMNGFNELGRRAMLWTVRAPPAVRIQLLPE
jgi:hypothetical protein